METLPVRTPRASGTRFLLHEHPGVTDAAGVCAALGVPLYRTVKTLAFATHLARLGMLSGGVCPVSPDPTARTEAIADLPAPDSRP